MKPDQNDKLKLKAVDLDDLPVLSAAVQDALVPMTDMAFIEADRSFVMVANRFRWEQSKAESFSRTHAGLRIDHVRKVQFQGMDPAHRDRIQELMTVSCNDVSSPVVVMLHFSGGGKVRLEVERLEVTLEDFGEPWPTQWKPEHGN